MSGATPLRLGDVTEVVEGNPVAIGDAIINDGPGLLLIVEKQPWGNTLAVTREVEAALEKRDYAAVCRALAKLKGVVRPDGTAVTPPWL